MSLLSTGALRITAPTTHMGGHGSHKWTEIWASQVVPVVKNPPAKVGDVRDVGSIPGLGRSPGGGHGSPLQYSCLENPMDRGCTESATTKATEHVCIQLTIQMWVNFQALHSLPLFYVSIFVPVY